ncbi:hypothetical protein HanRHA438_Chr06g0248081 [Helianthus annuus]|uniref:Uncharacterized protein n=1 Tax=Helianthus annuus TaxID=4232 RepID=A0A251UFY0_HELAN|nr:hypothetical protein HanXRQr2_Chr06g0238941 [Helianthus annuus]KAJ0559023.1 hypothetical protein HanHA300_Chr06g0195841 [Helianthus annuus]KAJ0564890.1 hypothetical protein HanIR_Chr06g0256611 [Helianthus annuus]KAJ0571966.1 hypothetical protein HanHA89_Chr06g0210671 [Helianthus annuus]KAJ0736446.1 hypothetical protein HanLR1_Chr06g0196091 [Helianthus annuus]
MFSHGIRIGLTLPVFLTRVYKVPNKGKSFIHQTLIRRSICLHSLLNLPCLRCTASRRQTLEVIHNCDPHNCPVHHIIVGIYMEIDGDIDGLLCIHPLSLCAVLTKHMVYLKP